MLSVEAVVLAVVYLIIAGIIFGLLFWAINFVGLPEPFGKLARVVLVLGAVFVCIAVLLSMIGHPIVRW